IRARIVSRRGRFHMFESLKPARTALVVIDMQRAFCAPGAPIEVPLARAIIPNINHLAQVCRAAGVPVIWVRMTAWDRDGVNSWPLFYSHFATPDFGAQHLAALTAGSDLHALADGLDVAADDLVIDKTRFSALIQGASDLDAVLRTRCIDTLIIAGTLTNRCCESTARDAMMIGYKVVFVEDANATTSDDEHQAALINVAVAFGDLRRTNEMAGLLGG
ncbi:MAG: isochorismatase family cysteine hydrolase, partial [Gemmobacter sp.]|nr:isochorismatase family cysteine hydrolase [Gemmobacter sp.]